MKESALRNKTMAYLNNLKDAWFYKASDRYTSGVPDIIGCFRGRFVAIELKAKGGKVSGIQKYQHLKILESGCEVIVADDFEILKSKLEEIYGIS